MLQMGLGKTVELLACVLANPFTPTKHAITATMTADSNKVICLHGACLPYHCAYEVLMYPIYEHKNISFAAHSC